LDSSFSMPDSHETLAYSPIVQATVSRLFRHFRALGALLLSAAAFAQTRPAADFRATANLDEMARRPESHALRTGAPVREIFEPERAVRRRNTAAAAMAATSSREPDTTPGAAALVPPVYNGFQALADNFTAIPPDTEGAIGPQHIVTMLNTQVTIQSRNGVVRSGYPITLTSFWSPLGTFNGNSAPFDPRVYYDASADRWIAVSDSGAESSTSALLIATSQTGDPGGVWNYYKIAVGANNVWADFPCVGFNANWIVVSTNMFQVRNGNYVNTNLYVFSKADLYNNSGGKGTYNTFNDDNGEFTTAIDIDNSSPNTLYLLQALATDFGPIAGSGSIRVSKLLGPVGSETFAAGNGGFTNIADPWSDTGPNDADFGPQAGTATRIDTGDSRLGNCLLRNGSIWCAHTIFLPYPRPTRASSQWFQLDPSTNPASIVQRGRVDDPTSTYFYAYPSIAVNKKGDALIAYTRFSANDFPTAEFSYRTAADPLNTMEPDTIFKVGESSYVAAGSRTGSNRWGDYSMTLVDPINDLNFWTIQEYASTPPSNRSGAFGTWWAQVVAPSTGLHCSYSVDASKSTFDASGGSGTIQVSSASGCLWQAAGNTNWISIAGGNPGSGSGTVQFTVAASSAAARNTTITVAGQNIPIMQGSGAASAPTLSAQGLVNAASYQGGNVAPGELVTLFGTGLGPSTLQKPIVSAAGVVDTIAGGTRVLFDGIAAPMIYSTAGQISAVVPFAVQGQTQVQVEYNGVRSTAITIPVVAATPAIFTADSSGKGQGAILNQDFSVNGASNPATVNSVIAIYLTGAGAMQTAVADGTIAKGALNLAQSQNVTVHIGGIAVKPLYAGAAPGIVEGVAQIDAVIPAGVTTGNAVPVDVAIGGVTGPAGVTVAIR
jgi:uncharacterized protein (TIGR03437 family)